MHTQKTREACLNSNSPSVFKVSEEDLIKLWEGRKITDPDSLESKIRTLLDKSATSL